MRGENFSASKIRVIYNGVDLSHFSPQMADPSVRLSQDIPIAAPLCGLVAALRIEKNVETFLQAAAWSMNGFQGAHFVVVGNGARRGKLEHVAGDLGLARCVHFVGMCGDVRPWLRTVNAFALTSICEAFPVSLLEAMACGKPVVTTRVSHF